jgi:hypothetical protein
MADFQYILPGAVGLPQGSYLYLWNGIPTSFVVEPACETVTSPRGLRRFRERAVQLNRDDPGVQLSTQGYAMAGYELLNSVITLVQVRSHEMAEVANGGHGKLWRAAVPK